MIRIGLIRVLVALAALIGYGVVHGGTHLHMEGPGAHEHSKKYDEEKKKREGEKAIERERRAREKGKEPSKKDEKKALEYHQKHGVKDKTNKKKKR